MDKYVKQHNKRHWNSNITHDPYITGWHFTKFILPSFTAEYISGMEHEIILDGHVMSVDLPKIEAEKYLDLSGQDKLRLTKTPACVTFLEMSGTPIHHILTGWFQKVIEINKPGDHKTVGKLYYWTTQPNGRTLEYCCCLEDIYPLTNGDHNFSADITINDKLLYKMEFNCSRIDKTKRIQDKVLKFIDDNFKDTDDRPTWATNRPRSIDIDEDDAK